ncbi:hypothetical protein I551_0545 [Mycobacterium ulcerans str. Harvey]|uniref:Uncharacterized protein n=1 Tax=Mycobacterium ulcerans str. Harvey TaxID=1299332 RepID=A0ABP3ASR6_MYCUL|nr:hypothetical protein I551_0545 [Mycobacterium ulcerans str. Harvey]
MLEVAIAERVVQRPAGALGVLGGSAHDVHHRYVFGVAARDGVGRGKLADSESRYHRRHST